MQKNYRCSKPKALSDFQTEQTIEGIQPFPNDGVLTKNLSLEDLASRISNDQSGAYSYIVTSVEMSKSDKKKAEKCNFEQHGSGPNFQGGKLTLCTCKHQMRSRRSAEDWLGLWIAGFTSRTIHAGKHWLFYLAKIESAHDSHSDLWSSMDAGTRNDKATNLHYLGDIYEPKQPLPTGKARFSPSRYMVPPLHDHRKDRRHTSWHNDINYDFAYKSRHPPLLVADPKLTFLWNEPKICFNPKKHCRDYFKWSSLEGLVAKLREAR